MKEGSKEGRKEGRKERKKVALRRAAAVELREVQMK